MLESKSKIKALGPELNLTTTKTGPYGRIIVEFKSVDGKMVRQKSFQDTHSGRKEADDFAKSIKNIKDLRKYFGIKEN